MEQSEVVAFLMTCLRLLLMVVGFVCLWKVKKKLQYLARTPDVISPFIEYFIALAWLLIGVFLLIICAFSAGIARGGEFVMAMIQMLFGVVGMYCLWQGMTLIRRMTLARNSAQVWRLFFKQMAWLLAALVGITLCGATMGLGVMFMLATLGLMICAAVGGLQAYLVHKRLTRGEQASGGIANDSEVVIEHLVSGRVRGLDGSIPIRFTDDELLSQVGTQGFVSLLSWDEGLSFTGGAKTAVPVMGFRNGSGASFVLYADDQLSMVPTKQGGNLEHRAHEGETDPPTESANALGA